VGDGAAVVVLVFDALDEALGFGSRKNDLLGALQRAWSSADRAPPSWLRLVVSLSSAAAASVAFISEFRKKDVELGVVDASVVAAASEDIIAAALADKTAQPVMAAFAAARAPLPGSVFSGETM